MLDDVDVLAVPVAPPVEGETELQPRTGTADAAALYGVDLAEVADVLGIAEGTVKSSLSQARKTLARTLRIEEVG